MSRHQLISTIFMIVFLYSSPKNLSSNSATQQFKVSQKLSDCWGHSVGIGGKLKNEIDVSRISMSFTFRCRADSKRLSGPLYELKLHECLFDSIWVINYNGKRYQTCAAFNPKQTQEGESPHLEMTCKNLGTDNYEIINIDLSKFYSVKDGIAKCIKPYPK
jgi:hypothetical protein